MNTSEKNNSPISSPNPSFFKRKKKVFLRIGGIFLTIWMLLALVANYEKETRLYFEKIQDKKERSVYDAKEKRIQEEYDQQMKDIEQLYRNDTYGGKTPEETFDLLIDALKKGDVELASRYYVMDEQSKALKDFKDLIKKYGNLDVSIKSYINIKDNGLKECFSSTHCSFIYKYFTDKDEVVGIKGSRDTILVPKGSKEEVRASFKINTYTKLWKVL